VTHVRGLAIGIAVVLTAAALTLGYRQLVAEADRLGQRSGATVAVPAPHGGRPPSAIGVAISATDHPAP